MDLIRDIIFILGTQCWQKIIDDESTIDKVLEDPLDAIERLVELFRVPLEAANANLNEICHEFELILSYSGQFIALTALDYQSV